MSVGALEDVPSLEFRVIWRCIYIFRTATKSGPLNLVVFHA